MRQELTPEIEDALRFVRVTIGAGVSGYLDTISSATLLIELNRRGLFVVSLTPHVAGKRGDHGLD